MIKNIFLSFRPKTLTAALVPCLAGTALSFHLEKIYSGQILLFAILAALFIQIGTNLVNDAVDFKKGADTETRLGPQRITQTGILKANSVLLLAGLSFLIALGFGVPLVLRGGYPILVIGVISVLMGYAYTAGPFPLAYLGLGDLFVILFFGVIAVNGMYYLQTLAWSEEGLVLGLQIGFHGAVLIAINNLRDIDGDRLVNKKTLAVRFGQSVVRFEIAIFSLLPFLMNFYWWPKGEFKISTLSWASLPLAILLIRNVFKNSPSPLYNKFLGQSAGLHLLFGLLTAVGLWLF